MTPAEFRKQMDEEEAECNRVAAVVVAAGCVIITLLWAMFLADVML